MRKIIVLGTNGQVSTSLQLVTQLNSLDSWSFISRQQIDLSVPGDIKAKLMMEDFDILINAAAYTKVDVAEDEPLLCRRVNAGSISEMIECCEAKNAKLLHFTSDYVFDGKGGAPYKEDSLTNALSVYGKSKELSEQLLAQSSCAYTIIRTSWLYSHIGHNFFKTIFNNVKLRPLSVVYDQVGTPTSVLDLAHVVKKIVDQNYFEREILHYSNEGVASWYDFAVSIRDLSHKSGIVLPIRTEMISQKAFRPPYSVLAKEKIKSVLNVEIPHWRESLEYVYKGYKNAN